MNIKNIITELKELGLEKEARKEAVKNMLDNEADFYINDGFEYRFIHQNNIDEIQQEELLSDLYVLGCFTSWFIADIVNELDTSDVEQMQKAEQFECLGKLMSKHIEEVQEKYSSIDGYGHHFNHYDFGEEEIGNYHVFNLH